MSKPTEVQRLVDLGNGKFLCVIVSVSVIVLVSLSLFPSICLYILSDLTAKLKRTITGKRTVFKIG